MNEIPMRTRRWLIQLVGTNPLVRPRDRMLARAEAALVVVALLLIPFAGMIGSVAHGQQLAGVHVEQQNRHPATAILAEDAPPLDAGADTFMAPVPKTAEVRATVQSKGGAFTDTVSAAQGASAGDEIAVWVDDDGTVVGPPRSEEDAAATAIAIGVLVWLAPLGLLAAALGFSRLRLAEGWEREWRRYEGTPSHP